MKGGREGSDEGRGGGGRRKSADRPKEATSLSTTASYAPVAQHKEELSLDMADGGFGEVERGGEPGGTEETDDACQRPTTCRSNTRPDWLTASDGVVRGRVW